MCSRPCSAQSPSYRQREWITKVGKADFDLNRQTTEIQTKESQIHVTFSSQGNTIMWQWFGLWRDTVDWISVGSSRKGCYEGRYLTRRSSQSCTDSGLSHQANENGGEQSGVPAPVGGEEDLTQHWDPGRHRPCRAVKCKGDGSPSEGSCSYCCSRVHACEPARVTHLCKCTVRALTEVNASCIKLLFSTLFFERGLLNEPKDCGLRDSPRLAGQQAAEVPLSCLCLSSRGLIDAQCYI